VRAIPLMVLMPLYAASCFPQGEWLNYLRPYLAALLIGNTLLNGGSVLAKGLTNRALSYIAGISYALYVLHPLLAASWLGSGSIMEKYAKRPLMFLALFLLAHLSTFYFERRCIAFGKKLGGSSKAARRPASVGLPD
jgi:peptidoglycan/LPS O-acetylase OafA/YrhL